MHDLHKKHIGIPVNGHDKSRVQNPLNHFEGKMLAKNWWHTFILQKCTTFYFLLKRFRAEVELRSGGPRGGPSPLNF